MSPIGKAIPDPRGGVAAVSVATTPGNPGGKLLTEADIPDLLREGKPLAEIDALQLASSERLMEIAQGLVESGEHIAVVA